MIEDVGPWEVSPLELVFGDDDIDPVLEWGDMYFYVRIQHLIASASGYPYDIEIRKMGLKDLVFLRDGINRVIEYCSERGVEE